MSRKFRYYADPVEVRKYIESLGYQTEETYNREKTEATGFTVCDTAVDLSYDLVVTHPDTGDVALIGYGLIAFWDNDFDTGGDAKKLERSRELYEKLYRRFRRR